MSESESPCPCMMRLCDERAHAHQYVQDELFISGNFKIKDGFDQFFIVLFAYFKCAAAAADDEHEGDVALDKAETLNDMHRYFTWLYQGDVDREFDRAIQVQLVKNGAVMYYNSLGQQGWRVYVDRMRNAYKSYAKMGEDTVKYLLDDYKHMPPDVFTDRMANEDSCATQPERWFRQIIRVMLYVMRVDYMCKPAVLRRLTYKLIDVDDDEFRFRRHCFYYFLMNSEFKEGAAFIKDRAEKWMAERRRQQRDAENEV
eukprot:514674-Pleurochrysis_carterae.AAC.1